MRTIIAGSRDAEITRAFEIVLNEFEDWKITEVVSGNSGNVDKAGEQWALKHNIPVSQFNAAWQTYGSSAGPRRNRRMAIYAEALIAFWDGKSRGTKNMIDEAKKLNLKVKVILV